MMICLMGAMLAPIKSGCLKTPTSTESCMKGVGKVIIRWHNEQRNVPAFHLLQLGIKRLPDPIGCFPDRSAPMPFAPTLSTQQHTPAPPPTPLPLSP